MSTGLARDRALGLARDLDRALALVRTLTDARDRARALADALGLARVRARTLDRGGDLARAGDLAAQPVDASGADLSDVEIGHLDTLDGIVWTHQTTWPPHIVGQVREHSKEIRPGVYQVRLGNTPDRLA